MSKLYELSGQLKELDRLVSENEVPLDQVKDTVDLITGEFEEKAVNIVKVVKNQQPQIDAIDVEIKRLQQMKKNITSKAENLKDYLRENMEANGINKIECPLFTILCKKPNDAVMVTNADLIPDEYTTVKTTIAPDKRAILTALKDGEDIPGVELSKAKSPLQIK